MNTKTIASLVALCATLFACSAGDDTTSTPNNGTTPAREMPPATQPTSGGTTAPCPAGEPAKTRPASPIEKCQGYFEVNSSVGKVWLHDTDRGCTVGADYFLVRPDGSADELGASQRKGTWKGDELYFEIAVEGFTFKFTRLPAEPSK